MLFVIDKPKGITSNQALSKFKKEHDIKKAGFSGVLDPFATGLLIIATDGDTKFLDLFLGYSKVYEGTMLFGTTTDTLDTDGVTIEQNDKVIDIDDLRKVIEEKFNGPINQIPPKYSNIKVDGKRAHELSRKNVEFELKTVDREVLSFEVNETEVANEFTFRVEVSSGTYIRALARDIAIELGTVGMLTELRRTVIGKVDVSMVGELNREEVIEIPFYNVNSNQMKDLVDGKDVPLPRIEEDEVIVKHDKRILWIKRRSGRSYKIYKNIQ